MYVNSVYLRYNDHHDCADYVLIYINNLWKPENTLLLILTTRELSMRLRTTKHGLPYIALQEEGKKIFHNTCSKRKIRKDDPKYLLKNRAKISKYLEILFT